MTAVTTALLVQRREPPAENRGSLRLFELAVGWRRPIDAGLDRPER
jgi:hypothetical protein